MKNAAKKKGNIILVGASTTTEHSSALSALDTNLPLAPEQKSPQKQHSSVPTQQQKDFPSVPIQQQEERRDDAVDPVHVHSPHAACSLSTPGQVNFDDSFSSFSSPEEQHNDDPGKHHHNLSTMYNGYVLTVMHNAWVHFFVDNSLMFNLTVDTNTMRIRNLAKALARMEMLGEC